ncbi:DUF1796 family putative cysteine peptidase [Synechococcus sp. UW179B]|uniref:DUF1796 family putative cysteine peptidase n=1 Tax=Synechococcus sp. UW179B TaxID=2575516 RepID=UPI000E0F9FED|nr:DUF1796 family putative cysteine peptidase [Synechococcus sp. UW179B]
MKSFVSLGPTCVPAEILKASGLRTCSFGFDWARSGSVHLQNFMSMELSSFLDCNVFRPCIELQQWLSPTDSSVNTGDVRPRTIKYGFQYYYNPHRDLRLKKTHEYLRRSFSRLGSVMTDKSCEKVFVLSDYINKQHCEFLDKKDISEFLEETLDPVIGDYSIVIIRIRLINDISYRDMMVTKDRKGDRIQLFTVELPQSSDEESVRSHTYRLIGKKVFGNVSNDVLWRE